MKTPAVFLAAATLAAFAPGAMADGRNPGSTLIYPIHRSNLNAPGGEIDNDPTWFVIASVTNTNLQPSSGSTDIWYQYLNVITNSDGETIGCIVNDLVEGLTPADTRSVLTSCHNAVATSGGYLVITAVDPTLFKTPWSFNYLAGSELVVGGSGIIYGLNAIPFNSPLNQGDPTDLDEDEELDFDGQEYEGVPDELYMDVFIAIQQSSLTLLNLTGGAAFDALVSIDLFNDDELPLSSIPLPFRCWMEAPLIDISLQFSDAFLANQTQDDPNDLDIDCQLNESGLGKEDFETGWARIRGLVANSQNTSIQDPAILGAITAGKYNLIDGGHLLWESSLKQFNGDFLHFSAAGPDTFN